MDEASYLDIADVIETESPRASDDLRQLWRRIAFSILIRNTDDHLRNHGFLRTGAGGWTLSPAFDLNPDPRPGTAYLRTAIDQNTTEARVDVLMEVAELFGLRDDEARTTLAAVVTATSKWQRAARREGLESDAIDKMTRAFDHDQSKLARDIVGSLV